ncbi:polysaccharide deacetylase family protein [Streptomyces sp. NPDC002851]
MRWAHRLVAGVLVGGALVLSGCAESVDPIERLRRKAAEKPETVDTEAGARAGDEAGARAGDEVGAWAGAQGEKVSAATYRRWGLTEPLRRPPAPPTRKKRPRAAGPGLAAVVDRVPTRDKVVFLTFDDGAERDPRFVRMVRELRLPVSMFLTDSVVGPGYAHFGKLRSVGATVQNHTLDHPYMPGLSYEGQRWEICGQQEKLEERFGVRPRLFRPPYGEYNDDTLRAAADCGLDAVVLWRASMQIKDLRYAEGRRLRPGDIILAHFRGPDELRGASLTEMTARMLRRIQTQGFAVARLEDYL